MPFTITNYQQFDSSGAPAGTIARLTSPGVEYADSTASETGASTVADTFEADEQLSIVFADSGGQALGGVTDWDYRGYLDHGGVRFYFFQDNGLPQYWVAGTAEADGSIVQADFPSSVTISSLVTTNESFCFGPDTNISTPNGDVAIQDLAIGDIISIADGSEVAVKWIGRQAYGAQDVYLNGKEPVCIKAGALGENTPSQDLVVSADHGMILDGLVINASALVNGSTIHFVPAEDIADDFTYFHIETEDHNVIIANGSEAETFIDPVGRSFFDNHQEYLDLYGVERIIPEMKMPRISSKRMVPANVKERLGLEDTPIEQALSA